MEKTIHPVVTSRSTIAIVYIDSNTDHRLVGQLYNAYYDKTVPFQNEIEFLRALESLFDSLSFPSRFENYRHFNAESKRHLSRKSGKSITEQERKDLPMSREAAEKATFVIHVEFRRNATWQGTIHWVNEDKLKSFRSTLEMIWLIDEALDAEGAEAKITWE